jgi:ATP-dependent 26S proteasome regulatory subunit
MSPADLKTLTQEAGLAAMARGADAGITHEDFTEALSRLRAGSALQDAAY